MLAVLGLPQLVREGHRQVVLADVLLHLRIARVASYQKDWKVAMHTVYKPKKPMHTMYKQKKPMHTVYKQKKRKICIWHKDRVHVSNVIKQEP